jgi:hypothetical protein
VKRVLFFLSANPFDAEIAVQILIVFNGGVAFHATTLGGCEWGISLALGVMPIPLGALIRLVPNEPFKWAFTRVGLLGRDQVLPTASSGAEAYNTAVAAARDNLWTFANLRGGRSTSSSFILKSKSKWCNSSTVVTNPRNPADDLAPPSKLIRLLRLLPTWLLFGVPRVQYARGSSIRNLDLSTLQDSDITTIMESFRTTYFEELKLIIAVASFLTA